MGLDELRKGVLEKARDEARTVEKSADAEASSLVSKAEAQRKEILEAAKREAASLVQTERDEAVANAHLETKREMAKAREELVASIETDVWEELLKARKDKKAYAELLHSLIAKGRKLLADEGPEVVVYARAEDAKLLGELKGAKLAREPIECSGGVVITSADGRVRVDNTFEALFAEKRDELRIEIQHAVLKK
ncbi:V-type ATP synthase subunit E [Candidatus Burarchaeum australiense]|nr:V-type ATP synthase subunit E [Candidatus Burarchaeum australiense]